MVSFIRLNVSVCLFFPFHYIIHSFLFCINLLLCAQYDTLSMVPFENSITFFGASQCFKVTQWKRRLGALVSNSDTISMEVQATKPNCLVYSNEYRQQSEIWKTWFYTITLNMVARTLSHNQTTVRLLSILFITYAYMWRCYNPLSSNVL